MDALGTLKDRCDKLRAEIESIKKTVAKLKADTMTQLPEEEVMPNIVLAYRHLEDARMRLGKAIQADAGGVSIYDKETEQ